MSNRLLTIVGFLIFLNCTVIAAERKVWIDSDPACGMGKTKDVDDCLAIIAAIRSSYLNVVGLSTVYGNIPLYEASATGRNLMSTIRDLEPDSSIPPVYNGAGEPLSEGSVVPQAVRMLEIALSEQPMTILALGPMTNIAILLKKRPELADRITEIVAVAGQRPGQVFKVGSTPILHFHDLNVRMDVEAFDKVLRSGVPLRLIPFEVGMQAVVTRADLVALKTNGKLDGWVGERSTEWLDFWEGTLGASGFSPFDTMAVVYLTNPDLFSCDTISAKMIRRRGLFVVRDTLEVSHSIKDGVEVIYCFQVAEVIRNSITDFISSPDNVQY